MHFCCIIFNCLQTSAGRMRSSCRDSIVFPLLGPRETCKGEVLKGGRGCQLSGAGKMEKGVRNCLLDCTAPDQASRKPSIHPAPGPDSRRQARPL